MDAGIWRELIENTVADPAGHDFFRSLAEHADFAFMLVDRQGYCLYASQAMRSMTGFSAQELSSRPVHDLLLHHRADGSPFPKEDSPLHQAFTSGAGGTQEHDLSCYRKGGSRLLVHCIINPVVIQGRTVCTVMEICDFVSLNRSALQKAGAELTYRFAMEAANIGAWELDFSTNVATISPTTAQILGLPATTSTLAEHEWKEMVAPEDRERVTGIQKTASETGEPFVTEFRMCLPDKKRIWICSRGIVKKDASGRPLKSVGVVIDITRKRETEEALQRINQRLSLILESSGEGICGIESDHSCTFINGAGAAMLGYKPEELTGMPIHRAFYAKHDPNDLTEKERRLFDAITQGAVLRTEEDFFWRKDGIAIPVLYSVSPMVHNGTPAGVVVVFTDISERKRAEERERQGAMHALKAAETNAKFRTFFEQGSYFAGVVALDGTLIEVNRLSLEQCGFTRDEVIGKKFWEGGWWRRSAEIMERVRQCVLTAAQGKVSRREITYFWADGSEHVSEMTLAPVSDEDGKLLYIAATGNDITDKIRYARQLRRSEERFRSLSESSPDAILVEMDGKFAYANLAAVQLIGAKTFDELIGRRSFDFIEAEFREVAKAHRALNTEEKRKAPLLDLQIKRLDGSPLCVQAACADIVWENRPAVQIMLRDITELKQTQNKLRQMSERLQLAIEGSGEGVWDWDIPNNRFSFSGGLNRILGRAQTSTPSEAVEWHNAIHPDDYARVISAFQETLAEKTPVYECEYRLRSRSGNWKWIWARGVIVDRDTQGKPTLMTGTLSDITARKESDELAWRHANLDALTGLPNRRHFRERLELELMKVKRSEHQLAVLFIDLDGFKQVNDLFGHDAGDLLLMETARRLKCCVRETDTVARLGGDEFTVILTELPNLDHVEFVCQKILASLAETFHLGKDIGYISGSIGVSLFPMDAENPEDLLRKADQAMYAAKHTGKNQFNYFTKELDERAHERLRITNELRHALRNGQLEVHYQPVVDLKSGRIVKAEALLRWRHPKLGNIEPAEFIPMAEESGLIKQIGNWVFKQAALCCKQCTKNAGMSFQIGVNKSPIQFMARDTETNWLHFLSEQGLPPNSISVEITEGVLLHASAKVENRLIEFRHAGVEVALDDFGTGYSSMAYLQKFHIDYVKIDQSFIRNITSDPNSRTIAETIIIMAHKLGQKVIAEGVETREQLDCLIQAGCDYGQGYLFSPPVTADEMLDMVSRQNSTRNWLM